MTPLVLRAIVAVTPHGVPMLAGENRRVIAVQRFTTAHVGGQAVCQPVSSEEDAVLALGVVEPAEPAPVGPRPLVLRTGEASLTLAPDGSIRLEGCSFGVRLRDGVQINGATIELN